MAIASYLGDSAKFDNAMMGFGLSYAEQVGKDFETYTEAIKTGQVSVATDEVSASTLAFTASAGDGIQAIRTQV